MPAYAIEDFKQGMDLRKSYATAPAGSLRTLRNAFITSGAEIAKRSVFHLWFAAPPGSIGLVSRNGVAYVIVDGAASIADPTSTSPGIISLPWPTSIARVADWDLFNGNFYIVLQGTNGLYYHFYNQAPVTDATSGFNPNLQNVSSVRVYGAKIYGVESRFLRFSALNDPTQWNPPTAPTVNDGSGWIDFSSQDADSTDLVGLEVYYSQMAIFSKLSVQFWTLTADPAQNAFRQLLRNTGLLAACAVTQFGNGDVMFLSQSGVRSLRVQNISLTAGTTDVGTPFDEFIRPLLVANGEAWFAHARCMIQPRTGRLFITLPDRLLVLSTFQEPSVTAWSYFDAPFNFVDSCVAEPYLMFRGDDGNLYQYGGDYLYTFDATETEVITPALACNSPSTNKLFHAFDVGATGTWTLSVGCDPNNQTTEETVATFTGVTYVNPQMTMPESSTHISLRFRTTDTASPTIGNVMLLFDEGLKD